VSDESHTWTRLCNEFKDLRLAAHRHGLRPRWHELVERSRDGKADLPGWEALERELVQRNEAEDDMSLRGDREELSADGDDLPDESDTWPESVEDGEFGCPVDRCSRIDHPDFFGDQPRCELFDKDMIGRPQD